VQNDTHEEGCSDIVVTKGEGWFAMARRQRHARLNTHLPRLNQPTPQWPVCLHPSALN